MKNEQPLALKLPDQLDTCWGNDGMEAQAAAELRRLHEAHEWQYTMAGERLRRIEKLEAENEALQAEKQEKQELTDEQIDSACMNYRHDFGLLSVAEQDYIRFEAKEWAAALAKARGNE
jgi:hypothetical protein